MGKIQWVIMALPNDSLSQVTVKYLWKGLDQDDPTGLIDYEEAGIALNDPSQGLFVQLWTFRVDGVDSRTITVEADNTNGPIPLFTAPDTVAVTEIAGTFDQNMNPFVAFKQGQQWHYWWFDTQSAGMVTSDLPVGVDSCRCCLDDKRTREANSSDILLFYTLNGNLYHRKQRDRYSVDYLLRGSVGGKLVRVGMNGINRLQLKLQTPTI